MPALHTRIAALIALLIVAIGASRSRHRPRPRRPRRRPGKCQFPKASDDDTISILGRICDRRNKPQIPVEGVDDHRRGRRRRPSSARRPRAPTAPSRSRCRAPRSTTSARRSSSSSTRTRCPRLHRCAEPAQTEREVQINLDNDQPVTFPVGELRRHPTGKATQALQLLVGGIVFSVLLAMAALGLSLIFGTTGLTNFAHGELITFGAMVAFAVDQLPGVDPDRRRQHHRDLAADRRVLRLRRLRLGQRRRPCGARCADAAPA